MQLCHSNGIIERLKAHLTIEVYFQTFGVDNFETFSPWLPEILLAPITYYGNYWLALCLLYYEQNKNMNMEHPLRYVAQV